MPGAKRATVKDIAERAGVSLGSVHLALTGKPGLGDETRERILRAAKELNYRHNAAAAGLKRKTLRIGAVFPALTKVNTYFYTPIWQGARDYFAAMRDLNVQLIEMPYTGQISVTPEALDPVLDNNISGLLILGDMLPQTAVLLQQLRKAGTATVLVGSDAPASGRLCCVQAHNKVLGMLMAEILTRATPDGGKILVCAGDTHTPANLETVQGIKHFVQENSPAHALENIFFGSDLHHLRTELEKKLHPGHDLTAACSVTARGSVMLSAALEKLRGQDKIPAVGSDLFRENIQALEDGTFINLIYKNPYRQASLAAQLLVEYLVRDREPEQDVYLVQSEVVFNSTLPLYKNKSYRML